MCSLEMEHPSLTVKHTHAQASDNSVSCLQYRQRHTGSRVHYAGSVTLVQNYLRCTSLVLARWMADLIHYTALL